MLNVASESRTGSFFFSSSLVTVILYVFLLPSSAVTSTVTTFSPTFKSVLPTTLTLDFSSFVIALTSILVASFGTFKV